MFIPLCHLGNCVTRKFYMPKISVIVPIYGVEKYIEKCARTLFEQTLEDMEYIFVNDCTPDNSMTVLMKVLEDYPNRKDQVKVLENEHNLGQGGTRKRGILAATGDYIIHCDSDDWVDLDCYEKISEKASETDADIINCDFITHSVNGEITTETPEYPSPHDYIRCLPLVNMFLWSRAVKRSLIVENSILPPDGLSISEDLVIMMQSFYYAKTVACVHKTHYHYICDRVESTANQAKKSAKLISQQNEALRMVDEFFKSKNFDSGEGVMFRKKYVKDRYLVIGDYDNWLKSFPEVASYTWSKPVDSGCFGLLYQLAHKGICWPIKFYINLRK